MMILKGFLILNFAKLSSAKERRPLTENRCSTQLFYQIIDSDSVCCLFLYYASNKRIYNRRPSMGAHFSLILARKIQTMPFSNFSLFHPYVGLLIITTVISWILDRCFELHLSVYIILHARTLIHTYHFYGNR
jgi:hypothetical protein